MLRALQRPACQQARTRRPCVQSARCVLLSRNPAYLAQLSTALAVELMGCLYPRAALLWPVLLLARYRLWYEMGSRLWPIG